MRILGIDVGSTSVKAVELESAFRRYEVHEYHEQPIEPGADPMEAVRRLLAGLPKAPDKIAMSLRTSQVTFRDLRLPTRDKKAIQAGVGFELDDELPFPIENAVYDYSILSQTKAGTHLHVAATLERTVIQSLETWQMAGLDPDLLTTEAWAFRTYLNTILNPAEQENPVLVAQIGHERTVLYVHWQGTPILSREIDWGGRDLTKAICQRYQIPMDEAEKAKRDHGFVVPTQHDSEITKEQVDFSHTLIDPLQGLVSEIRRAALTSKNATHLNLSAIYLSGGTSQLPGLSRVIEESMHTPVRQLQALTSVNVSGVTYAPQTDGAFLLAASLALCLVGSNRSSIINFRKGPFAKVGRSREINIASLRRPFMAVGAITACLLVSLLVQSAVYKNRLKEVDSQLEKSVRGFFGQLAGSAVRTYLSNTTELKSKINKELAKQRELNRLLTPNPHSPLDFLKTLSASVPKDVVVDMIRYQAGAAPDTSYLAAGGANPAETASLTFLMANAQTAEKLSGVLSSKLGGLEKSKVEEWISPDGTGKKWKVTLSGKPTEDSYGK